MNKASESTLTQDSGKYYAKLTSTLARDKFDSLEKWLHSKDAIHMGLREVELGEELRGRELLRLRVLECQNALLRIS